MATACKAEGSLKRRRKGARERVLRILRRRWLEHLPVLDFPSKFEKQLRRHSFFRELVEGVLESDAVRLPPIPAGQRARYERMLEELGGDPLDFVCEDCFAEIEQGQRRCEPCIKWRNQGVEP